MSLSLSSLSLTTTSSSSEKMSSVLSSKSYLQQSDSFLYRKGTNNNAAASTTLQNVTAAAAAAAAGGGQCYRATSLWLRTVGLFRSGVPLGRHRGAGLRGVWRSYENSFVASEAVTWMEGKMKEEGEEVSSQENVKSNVTRAKIVLLLDKFLHAGVFQPAAASGNTAASSSTGKLTSFKDDRAVYRLCEVEAAEHDDDKENTSSNSSVAAGGGGVGTRRGVYVTEIRCTPMSLDEVHDLWESVFTARVVEVFGGGGGADPMLLLSSGEAAAGSLLKRNSEESVKLNHHQQWGNNEEVLPPSWLTSAMSFLTHYPRWKLLSSSSAGGGGGDTASSAAGSFYPNMCGDVLRLVTEYFRSYSGIRDSSDSTTFFDLVSRVFQQKQDNNNQQGRQQQPPPPRRHPHHRGEKKRYYEEVWVGAMSESTDALLTGLLLSPNDDTTDAAAAEELYYATEFLGVGSPLTRVLSERDIRAGAGGGGGAGYFNACLTLSPGDLINHPKYEGVRRRLFRQTATTSSSRSLTDLTSISNHGGMTMMSRSPLPPPSFLDDDTTCSSSSPSLRVVGLRLLLLQLPWGVRRHLYVLLRFMGGVSRNKLLQLDVAATNKDIMLSTFVDVVFPTTAATTSLLVDPYVSLYREQLVCYLMDNVEGLFSVDEDLLNSVKAQMQERQVQRVKVWRPLREEEGGDVYCAKVSAEEYDAQAYAMRNASLRDLLDAYCQKEDSKHTRKMVKKFREEYPHIYAEKFGPPSGGGKKNRVVAATATAAATAESSPHVVGGGRRRRVLGVL